MNLTHVTLIVSDFDRSKAFYLSLGLTPIVDSPPRYARFGFPDGDATLSVEVTGEGPAPSRAHIYLECADVDAEAAQVKAAGLVLTQEPTDMFYLWREARLVDPDGHELRLFHAGKNRLDPPWRVQR
jgi:catechol 2,3-dioxygenase-like lactoylglutathione lyase family enzyme